MCTWGEIDRHKSALSSAGNINKSLCSFKGERGESHNKQGEYATCACVFMCAREKKREGRGVREGEKAERDQSRGYVIESLCGR